MRNHSKQNNIEFYFEKKEMRKTIENQEKIIISLSETRITALKIKEILEFSLEDILITIDDTSEIIKNFTIDELRQNNINVQTLINYNYTHYTLHNHNCQSHRSHHDYQYE